MRTRISTVLACVILGGCGQTAAKVDPRDDVHCSVLAFYFHGLAKHENVPLQQIRATEGLHDWYAAKMRAKAGKRLQDFAVMDREVTPLLDAIKADPAAMRDEARACADRAAADPGFNDFARAYMR